MINIVIHRIKEDNYQTLGELYMYDNTVGLIFSCKTLELPWKENQKYISRIPDNHYQAFKHVSPKFGECVLIMGIPNRSEILIHHGNYNRDTLGCILVGENFTDIDGDGHVDVTSSKKIMSKLLNKLKEPLFVNILDKF